MASSWRTGITDEEIERLLNESDISAEDSASEFEDNLSDTFDARGSDGDDDLLSEDEEGTPVMRLSSGSAILTPDQVGAPPVPPIVPGQLSTAPTVSQVSPGAPIVSSCLPAVPGQGEVGQVSLVPVPTVCILVPGHSILVPVPEE